MSTTPETLTRAENELRSKQAELAALQSQVDELQRAVNLLRAAPPGFSLTDLEAAARALRRLESPEVPAETNGSVPPVRRVSLADKTIVESATQILREHQGRPVHYRRLAEEALTRGYESGRSSDAERVIASFGQTLRRIAGQGGVFERAGEGQYRLREIAKADGE